MYEELAKRIRGCSYSDPNGCEECRDCPNAENYYECKQKLALQAADAIEELQQTVEHYKGCSDDWYKEACDYKAMLPRWIPVEERLPELPRYEYCSKMVIAKVNGFGVMPMAYERTRLRGKVTERWRFYWDRVCTEEVTHWMPLPKPPKEET